MKSTYMFPPALLTGFAVVASLVFWYPKGDLKGLYEIVYVFVAFVGYLRFLGKHETDMRYLNFFPAQVGFATPLLLGALYLTYPTQSLWIGLFFLVVMFLRDWRLYETSPAGGFSMRHDKRYGIVWEDTTGMTPPEIRRMRRKRADVK